MPLTALSRSRHEPSSHPATMKTPTTSTQVLVILSAAKDLFRPRQKRPFAALRVTAIAVILFSEQYQEGEYAFG